MDDRCFCIFEGGGAKGIAHVGALAALEQSELDLCGFAGTSAGAVIAALAAAGYRSRDLVGSDRTILDLVDMDRSNIWMGDPKRPARTPRRLFGAIGWAGIVAARNGGMLALLAIMTGILMLPPTLVAIGTIPSSWAICAAIASLLVIVGLACLIAAGLASLNEFERCLNQLLRLRLAARIDPATAHRARSPDPVTFEDMERAGCPPLRVVASDISTRQLKLFSYTNTPNMSVAAAVAASVCLPIIFGPRRIGMSLHLDGGLVSNLPAWAFDAERALDRDAWTAVVQVSEDVKAERLWGVMILKAAILTGIFGSGLLNVRNVDRLKAVRLDVTLKLLQFDPGIELANKVVEDARLKCLRELVYQLKAVPKLMDDVCDRIRLRAERMVNLALGIEGRPQLVGRLRVSVFVYTSDDPSSLTADFQSGFGDSPDERIRLPIDGSIVGQALRERETLYLERRDPAWSSYLSKPSERWLRKLVLPELAWVLCIPYIRYEDGIEMVVSIDSTEYLDVESELVDTTMASISDRIVLMLDEYVPKEAFASGRSES